jgi:hypothetical protein
VKNRERRERENRGEKERENRGEKEREKRERERGGRVCVKKRKTYLPHSFPVLIGNTDKTA